MKKITSLLTLFLLVACQPSELERCIEANIKDLDEGEKILLELEEELNSIAPDLKLFEDFSTSLNLIYKQYPLAWEDGVELSREGNEKWHRSLAKKENFCVIFDFDSMEEYLKCVESRAKNLTEDEVEKLTISQLRKGLNANDKDFQQSLIFRYFQINHFATFDDYYQIEDLELLSAKKNPSRWTIGDMVLIIKETIEIIERFEDYASDEVDEFTLELWKTYIEVNQDYKERQLLFIKNSIESVKPELAEATCNSQGIY